jgi:hypothetical protein
MKKPLLSTLVLLSFFLLVNCSSNTDMSQTDVGDIPDWYMNPPEDDNYIFSSKTATSQDMQLAIDKATTDARAEIGRTIELKLESLQKRFDEEVGVRENATLLSQYTQATKTVVSTSLSGSKVKQKEFFKDGDIWRSYVMVEYPVGEANDAFVQQIKKQEELYTRFRSSETFKELEDEVKKYEQWKEKQATQ